MSGFWSAPSSTSILHVCEQRRLCETAGCAGSPEPSLIAYVIIISWAGSNGTCMENESSFGIVCFARLQILYQILESFTPNFLMRNLNCNDTLSIITHNLTRTYNDSCLFAGGVIMYIRFRHVETMFGNCPRMRSLRRLNVASFIIGMLTVLGVSVVGNFQVLYIQITQRRNILRATLYKIR